MADTENSSAANRIIQNQAGPIAPSQSQYAGTDQMANILDSSWVSNAFMVPDTGFTNIEDKINQYWTTANMKFTDTRLGANIGINPRPQFCQYSDVPVEGKLKRNKPSISDFNGNYGMGRQYSEFIDDAAQRVYMTFGVPQYNSIWQFFSAAYETNQATLARTGRATSLFYKAGNLIGSAALFYAFPLLSVGLYINKLLNFFIARPKSKFYNLKPTMEIYWNCVNQLVTAMAVNRGILPKFLSDEDGQRIGRPYKLDDEYLTYLSTFMPDIFLNGGLGDKRFDIISVSTRAQRLADRVLQDAYESTTSDVNTDWTGYVNKEMGTGAHATPITDINGNITIGAKVDNAVYLSSIIDQFVNFIVDKTSFLSTSEDVKRGMEIDPRANLGDKATAEQKSRAQTEGEGFFAQLDAQLRNGALFATFIVDHTGPQSESWSNAVTESELSQKLNGIVSSAAEARFTAMEGNIVSGIAGQVVGAVASAVTDTASGFLSGITGGISDVFQGLAGAGYIDIPKHWQSSSFNATRANYTMQLITPYGNPISQLMAIDIPLAMLLAGALPRSIGKSAYTAPFLCQIFDRGRCQIRLGMIEQLSFTRGTSHLSFNDEAKAMCVDVSFSVVDLSSIMHMPLSSGGIFDGIDMSMDEDNILQDYMAVLTGLSVEQQIYDIPKGKLRLAKQLMNISRITSPAHWAAIFGNSSAAEFVKMFTRRTATIDFTGQTLT